MSALVIRVSDRAGFCWGVRRALDLVRKAAAEAGGPVNTLGPLIHNPQVVADLESKGVRVISAPDQAEAGTVVVRSHGISREMKQQLSGCPVEVIDATCRYVSAVQQKAASLRARGYLVVIVGERDHPEVIALRSYAGDDSLVVETPAELPEEIPAAHVGVVVQTTQSPDRLSALAACLAPRVRELLVYNTICSATRQRQAAAVALAREVDTVIVVGGRDSGNTRRLAELCAAEQPRTYHVQDAAEVDPRWLDDATTVGITAGASTPPEQVDTVIARLRELRP